MIHSPLESLCLKLNGKSSTWCRKSCYDEMKGIETLWLRHQTEFSPIKLCFHLEVHFRDLIDAQVAA